MDTWALCKLFTECSSYARYPPVCNYSRWMDWLRPPWWVEPGEDNDDKKKVLIWRKSDIMPFNPPAAFSNCLWRERFLSLSASWGDCRGRWRGVSLDLIRTAPNITVFHFPALFSPGLLWVSDSFRLFHNEPEEGCIESCCKDKEQGGHIYSIFSRWSEPPF